MHNDYADIRARIDQDPQWFDEEGVPRYCDFHPTEVADIYADEAILLLIECQNCGREFPVCISSSRMGRYRQALLGAALDAKREARILTDEEISAEWERNSLAQAVERGAVHYGDPPNADCCGAGASMNSVPVRVLEFWRYSQEKRFEWERVPALEIAIPDRFADDPDEVLLPASAPAAAPPAQPARVAELAPDDAAAGEAVEA